MLLTHIYIILLFTTNLNALKQLHLLFRHGERTPSALYKTDPNNSTFWQTLGLGQLTNRGKLQIFNLGRHIRTKYSDFIPQYYKSEDVKILSSFLDRCLMSAELFAAGLFPPKYEQIWNPDLLWQPVVINYKNRNEDNMITAKQNCSKYDEIYEKLYQTHPKYVKLMEQYQELLQYLSNKTGENYKTFRQVEELYNTLEIEKAHNFLLPDWTDQVFPCPMYSISVINLASFTETTYMKRMKGGTWLKHVLNEMNDIKSAKVHVYAGHDLTIVTVLRAMGYMEPLKPTFGSYVIMELHGNSEIKIFYSDTIVEKPIHVEGCGTPCLFDNLKNALSPVLPSNWTAECSTI